MDADPDAEAILEEARQLPAGEETDFLDSARGEYPALRQIVEPPLAAGRAADEVAVAATLVTGPSETAGVMIGRYKLLQRLGEGGMGTVWMAEQREPMVRRVALKIIKPGMDTQEVAARFDQERQALALMDHPNIAKVFDGGTTPTGRMFFVMELVHGIKITDYCDHENHTTAERLALFIQVCHAVQHAHQKGIIHRDLKPSNILVELHENVPVPKIIDFGVAKATQQRLTDLTLVTRFEQMIGTPLYMSPEQAEMTSLDIDTRSDIYSLGVLLYELLTGRTPFDPVTLMQHGLDEIRRIIREQEPPRPSAAVGTMAADVRTTVAQHRRTETPKLIGLLRGDLDWIVMKALEKNRSRRYDNATAFADDLARHLASVPVVARPPSQLYRFRRLVKRNKLAFAAGSAVFLALLVGCSVSTYLYFVAKNNAETSAKVATVMEDLLTGVPPSVHWINDTTKLQETLDKATARLGAGFKDQPHVEAKLRGVIGYVYESLGDFAKSEAMYRQALEIERNLHGEEHPAVAAALSKLAHLLYWQGRLAEAETVYRRVLDMRTKLLGQEHPDVAISLGDLANVLGRMGKMAEAEKMHRQSLKMRKTLLGNENVAVADSLDDLGRVLQDQSKLVEAEVMYRSALEMRKTLLGAEHRQVAFTYDSLAKVLKARGNLSEAETIYRQLLRTKGLVAPTMYLSESEGLKELADVLRMEGKLVEAEAVYRAELEIRRKISGEGDASVATSLMNLGDVLESQGKLPEADAMFREALEHARKLFMENSFTDLGRFLCRYASVLAQREAFAEARSLAEEAAALYRRFYGEAWPDSAPAFTLLDKIVVAMGDDSAHQSLLREQKLSLLRRQLSPYLEPLVSAGRLREAEKLAGELIDATDKNPDPRALAEALRVRGELRGRAGHWSEAAADYRRTLKLDPTEHSTWYKLGPLLLQEGDTTGYDEHRNAMLGRFPATDDPKDILTMERTAKVCLLRSVEGDELKVAGEIAAKADALGEAHQLNQEHTKLSKGLAEMRRGDYAKAVSTLHPVSGSDSKQIQSYAVLAMAFHRLVRPTEARAALIKGMQLAAENVRASESDGGVIGYNWQNFLIAQLLLREAQALLAGK